LGATCGKAQVESWKGLIANGQYEELVEDLLVKHYDRYYDRSMKQLQSAEAQGNALGTDDVSDVGFMELARRIAERK
jgi:hypothetical protein